MFRLFKYLKNYKKQVIWGPIFKFTEAIFELIVPLVMAKIIDIGVNNRDTEYVLKMGGVLLILSAAGFLFSITCQYLASVASQGFGTELRDEMFKKVNTFSFAEMDKFGSSSLVTRITNDVNQLQLAVAMLIRLVVRAPFLVVGAVIMASIIDFKLSAIFLAASLLIAVILYLIMSGSIPRYREIQKKMDKIMRISKENLEGTRVIRAFARQDAEKTRFNEASGDFTDATVNVGKISALLNPLTYLIVNAGIVAVLWFGGKNIFGGSLLRGELIALINYMSQILLALVVVANLVVLFTRASASAARVNEVMDTAPLITEGKLSHVPDGANKVSFENVRFSYGGKNVLDGISFNAAKSHTIGIVGTTGSGKTTLISLIPRFYDVSEGAVLIDGVNVKDYTFTALRSKVGVVLQGAALFHGTVRENMKIGKENACDDEIKDALKTAMAYEFVEKLPNGLDEVVSQSGVNLSGGQKQRLSIARTLITKPEILILDDSFSALDYVTEAKLRQSLRENSRETTIFIISQRIISVKYSDKILVMGNEKILDSGSHGELYERCEEYRKLCMSQEVSL